MMKKAHWLKSPRTFNEKRQNQDGWCRPKRRPNNLVDRYDDRPHGYQKSWKKFRKTQYHTNGRGQKHSVILPAKTQIFELECYFKDHNIPYKIREIKESKIYTRPIRKKRVLYKAPNYVIKYVWIDKKIKQIKVHQAGYRNVYKWYNDGYKQCSQAYLKEYEVTWWSNKDIGIEYLI
jgi:hypothetical protein